jgi:hypothetical protein
MKNLATLLSRGAGIVLRIFDKKLKLRLDLHTSQNGNI